MNLVRFDNPKLQLAYAEAYRQYIEEIQKGFDVVLPPEEQVPEFVDKSNRAVAEKVGNWGRDYLVTNELIELVIDRAKKRGAKPVHIVIGDTAPWFDHGDLQPFADHKYAADFVKSGRQDARKDLNGHGTHCAGIVAADSERYALGVLTELAKEGFIKLVPAGFLNDNGSGAYSWIEAGIDYCREVKDKTGGHLILSMSLGGNSRHTGMERAIDALIKEGGFVSASAGNRGGDGSQSTMGFPGNYPPVMGIASHEADGSRSVFSSVGNLEDERIWNTSPGGRILSTYRNGTYAYLNGTSMSNPHSVAINAALLLLFDAIDRQEIMKEIVAKNAYDLGNRGYDIFHGYGSPKLEGYVDDEPVDEPEDPVDDPDEPGDEPKAHPVVFESIRTASVVFKDHESKDGYITGYLGGYMLDVHVKYVIKNHFGLSEKLHKVDMQVRNFFNFFQNMTIESRQDPKRISTGRKVYLDGPVNLKTITEYFGRALQASLNNALDFEAKIVEIAVDDNEWTTVRVNFD